MSHSKGWTNAILVSLILGCLVLSGCARGIVLHPIQESDIKPMTKGVAYAPEKDGWFLSNTYVKEVMEAKVK